MRTVLLCSLLFTGLFSAIAQDTLLTLDRAIELALQNNFDIRIAHDQREQAANNSNAGTAGMLPRVDLNGAYAKTIGDSKQHLSSGLGVDKNNAVSDNTSANVALTWTVFDGLKMFATRKKLAELAAQGDQALKIRIENTIAQVITAYYGIVQQRQLLGSLGRQIAVAEEVVRINDRKATNGAGSRLDLLLASADLNAQRSEQITTQAAMDDAKVSLRNLLALDATTNYSVQDTVIITYDPSLEQLMNDAGKQNSTLLLYDRQQRIAELGVKEYEAMHLPVINLNGAYQFARAENNASFLLLNQSLGYTFGVTATLPLFNGSRLNTQVKNAKLDLLVAQLEYAQEQHALNADVLKAWQEFQSRKSMMALEEGNIADAREILAIAEERFRVGASSLIELKDAKNTYGAAMRRLAGARYDAKLAETELRRLAGVLVR